MPDAGVTEPDLADYGVYDEDLTVHTVEDGHDLAEYGVTDPGVTEAD